MLQQITRIIATHLYTSVRCNQSVRNKGEVILVLGFRRCATSRTVPRSITGGVTGDFFPWYPERTMCPEVDSASESEYQGFLLG